MKKIRVLHFELSDKIGGIESFLFNLYKMIDHDKFIFSFITTVDEPGYENEFAELGATIYKIPPYYKFYDNKKAIKNILEYGQQDIIHIHKNSAANILPVVYAKRYANVPIVLHSHNTKPSIVGATDFLHQINRSYLNRSADYKLACSNKAGKWLFNDDNFMVIKNGIISYNYRYDSDVRVAKRKELGLNESSFVIGHIGRFSSQKNHEMLIEIFRMIKLRIDDSYLILVGVGDLQEKIKGKVRERNLSDCVLFLGERKDIPALLSSMDAFVFPSLYEGLGIAAIEAQAAGLQTYISDGVVKETEVSSFVSRFALSDPLDEIAEKICNDRENKADNDRNRGQSQIICAGYDMSVSAGEIEKIYTETVEKKG